MANSIFITLKKEIRAILRDRKSLIIMLLTPFLIPLYIFSFSAIFDNIATSSDSLEDETKYEVGINYNLNEEEKAILENIPLNIHNYSSKQELETAYTNKEIVAYILYTDKNYQIYMNNMNEESSIAGSYLTNYLDTYNTYLAQIYIDSIGADSNRVYHNINYQIESLSGSNEMMDTLISVGFTFAIMSICLTAIYTTTDATAGEKERGT